MEYMLAVEHNMVLKKGAKSPVSNYPALTHPGLHPRPTLPLLKLITQSEVLGQLGRTVYTVEDANAHLATKDVTWNYTTPIQKTEVWQLV